MDGEMVRCVERRWDVSRDGGMCDEMTVEIDAIHPGIDYLRYND